MGLGALGARAYQGQCEASHMSPKASKNCFSVQDLPKFPWLKARKVLPIVLVDKNNMDPVYEDLYSVHPSYIPVHLQAALNFCALNFCLKMTFVYDSASERVQPAFSEAATSSQTTGGQAPAERFAPHRSRRFFETWPISFKSMSTSSGEAADGWNTLSVPDDLC